jgi:hypothetical protein
MFITLRQTICALNGFTDEVVDVSLIGEGVSSLVSLGIGSGG